LGPKLADAPHGRTVADMLAHGFTNALLDRLASDGLATIQPGTMRTTPVSERLPTTSGGRSDEPRRSISLEPPNQPPGDRRAPCSAPEF
jgi:hypothetical protein